MSRRIEKDRLCSLEGCNKVHYGRGWCQRHYLQERNGKTPTMETRRCGWSEEHIIIAERMWANGKSHAQIGEAVGRAGNTVNKFMGTKRDRFPLRGKGKRRIEKQKPKSERDVKPEHKPKPEPRYNGLSKSQVILKAKE